MSAEYSGPPQKRIRSIPGEDAFKLQLEFNQQINAILCSHHNLRRIAEEFNIEDNVIYRGKYTVVFDAKQKSNGRAYVAKFFGYTRLKPEWKWLLNDITDMVKAENSNRIALCGIFLDSVEGLKEGKKYNYQYPVYIMEKFDTEGEFEALINRYSLACHPEDFSVEGILNKGGYGMVCSAVMKTVIPAQKVAIKYFGYLGEPQIKWIMKEIEFMAILKASGVSNVPRICGTFLESGCPPPFSGCVPRAHPGSYPAIVMEKLEGGDLLEKVSLSRKETNGREYDKNQAIEIFINIALTLQQIHRASMIVCDLKLDNIVLEDNYSSRIRIVDFGAALLMDSGPNQKIYTSDFRGTPGYFAPETLLMEHDKYVYSEKTDIWQLGCILYLCLHARHPFGVCNPNHRMNPSLMRQCKACSSITDMTRSSQNNLRFSSDISDATKELLAQLLHKDPVMRPDIATILQHSALKRETENEASIDSHSTAIVVDQQIVSQLDSRPSLTHQGTLSKEFHNNAKVLSIRRSLKALYVAQNATALVMKEKISAFIAATHPSRIMPSTAVVTLENIRAVNNSFVQHSSNGSSSSNSSSSGSGGHINKYSTNRKLTEDQLHLILSDCPGLSWLNVHGIFSIFDTTGTGLVRFTDFLLTLLSFHQSTSLNQHFNDYIPYFFEVFNAAGNGKLTRDDLLLALAHLEGDGILENEGLCADIFESMDTNHDGWVTLEEFKSFFAVQTRESIHATFA